MGSLHLLDYLHNHLTSLTIPTTLLRSHQLVVLLDALQSLLQDRNAFLREKLSMLADAGRTDAGSGVVGG